MAKKKSASQLAAEMAYFKENKIPFEVKAQKPNKVSKATIEKAVNSSAQKYGLGNDKEMEIYIQGINKTMQQVQFLDDKEVIKQILLEYEIAFERMKCIDNLTEMIDYLRVQCLHQGICYFARNVLGYRITDSWWIVDNSPYKYWYLTPVLCTTISEVIMVTSRRIEKLKEILNSLQ